MEDLASVMATMTQPNPPVPPDVWRDEDKAPGWLLVYEEAFLQSLCMTLPKGSTVINIGAGAGTSTCAMLRANVVVLSIDSDQAMLDKEKAAATKQGLDLNQFYQVCVTSHDAIVNIRDERADLIFVDGSHSYEGVKQDLIDYPLKLKPGGLLVCHDYEDKRQVEVTQAIKEWRAKHRKWLEVGRVLHMIAFRKPGGDEGWRNGRI